jgi:preprotein translocase subunit SecG
MEMLFLAKVGFGMKLLFMAWFVLALLMILIVLVQKGKGGGLSGAFGGAGGAGGLLGTKIGDVLTWITISIVALFLIVTLLMVKFYRPQQSNLGVPDMPESSISAPAEADADVEDSADEDADADDKTEEPATE